MVCFVHFDLEMCFAPQRRALFRKSTSEPPKVDRTWCVLYILTSKCASRHNGVHFFESRHLSLQKWSEHVVLCTFSLGNVLRATTACTFSTSQLPKVVRPCCALYILTWTCASRHNGVHFWRFRCRKSARRCGAKHILKRKCTKHTMLGHFFDIATYKSGPDLVCFVHFHLEMCFAPQRRALFRHRNVQKWSGPGVFCTFSLGNVLRATTACTFSSPIWPAASAPAALASLLFHPPEPQIIGKTQGIATFSVSRRSYLFAHLHLLSSDSFSSLIFSLLIFLFSLPLSCSAFHLSILSEV